MLGGYEKFGGGEVQKIFKSLTSHSEIKIKAIFHFIDFWSGETAYLKINTGRNEQLEYIWTENYSMIKEVQMNQEQFNQIGGTNLCGNSKYPEQKFTISIDVTVDHLYENLKLAFGTTLNNEVTENSWGISNLQIFVK